MNEVDEILCCSVEDHKLAPLKDDPGQQLKLKVLLSPHISTYREKKHSQPETEKPNEGCNV